jgi:hypothetical protein
MRRHSAAKPQLNFHREGHEGREVLKKPIWSVLPRALHVLRGEEVFSKMGDFCVRHCKDAKTVEQRSKLAYG